MKSFIIYCVAFVVCSSALAQEFKASTQKGVDLKKYETFRIEQGEIVTSEDSKMDKEQFFKDFKRIAITELESKGYKYTEDTTANLSFSYVVETMRVIESENVGPLGQMPQRTPGEVQTQTWSRDFTRGSLIISVEAGKSNLVWSTEGTMDVARTRGGNVLEYSIRNALKDFPDKNAKERKRKRNKKG